MNSELLNSPELCYFTETEAKEIKGYHESFIGREFWINADKKSGLRKVEIQPSKNILSNGKIESGYIVALWFNEGPALMPAVFAGLNGTKVFKATHVGEL